ncbi:hypothetical protein CMI47_13345 [Candidatus Pacearchaeota archaeon]|nr:hypothetical protein [Candidatus Pacearchaeota archaeon]|tara:strand:- start:1557 stop:2003 length:447 start_codon:yes stop_codon:yes gene_type:complete
MNIRNCIEYNEYGEPALTEANYKLFTELYDVFTDHIKDVAYSVQKALGNKYIDDVVDFELPESQDQPGNIEYKFEERWRYGGYDTGFALMPERLVWDENYLASWVQEKLNREKLDRKKHLRTIEERKRIELKKKLNEARKLLQKAGEL